MAGRFTRSVDFNFSKIGKIEVQFGKIGIKLNWSSSLEGASTWGDAVRHGFGSTVGLSTEFSSGRDSWLQTTKNNTKSLLSWSFSSHHRTSMKYFHSESELIWFLLDSWSWSDVDEPPLLSYFTILLLQLWTYLFWAFCLFFFFLFFGSKVVCLFIFFTVSLFICFYSVSMVFEEKNLIPFLSDNMMI